MRLSERGQRFLQQFRTLPRVDDMGLVRDALARKGVPATDALLDFHQHFAGHCEWDGNAQFVFGLIHEDPESEFLKPMEVEAFNDRHAPDDWMITCADAHPSFALQLDPAGIYYTTCGVPFASSFSVKIEQDAFQWEFEKAHPGRHAPLWLWNDADEMVDVLLPRLEKHVVKELSDRFSYTYITDSMTLTYRTESKWFSAYVAAGARPPE